MEFGEISNESGSDRYALSGTVSIAPPADERIDLCASERAAVNAKEQEIRWLQGRRDVLQVELQHAAPQNKGAIVDQITATNVEITRAEQELPDLRAALEACMERRGGARTCGTPGQALRPPTRLTLSRYWFTKSDTLLPRVVTRRRTRLTSWTIPSAMGGLLKAWRKTSECLRTTPPYIPIITARATEPLLPRFGHHSEYDPLPGGSYYWLPTPVLPRQPSGE